MIYEVRTLEIGSKLYRANGYPDIDMMKVLEQQKKKKSKPSERDWDHSLYFSNDPNVCAAYMADCEPGKYLIEITLKKPIKYVFTDDPCFFSGGASAIHMKETVVPETSKAIREHSYNEKLSEFHYPNMPFMQELGDKNFAFSDIMVNGYKKDGETRDIQHEIIIPHSLLIGSIFTQRSIEYKMNSDDDGFEWVRL